VWLVWREFAHASSLKVAAFAPLRLFHAAPKERQSAGAPSGRPGPADKRRHICSGPLFTVTLTLGCSLRAQRLAWRRLGAANLAGSGRSSAEWAPLVPFGPGGSGGSWSRGAIGARNAEIGQKWGPPLGWGSHFGETGGWLLVTFI